MSNASKYDPNTWLVICDGCGVERFRSECDFTWDGYLMCHLRNCWYDKHAIFEIPPVQQDPQPLFDTRPDQVSGTETYVDEITGFVSKFGGPQFGTGSYNGRAIFSSWHVKFGTVDTQPPYYE